MSQTENNENSQTREVQALIEFLQKRGISEPVMKKSFEVFNNPEVWLTPYCPDDKSLTVIGDLADHEIPGARYFSKGYIKFIEQKVGTKGGAADTDIDKKEKSLRKADNKKFIKIMPELMFLNNFADQLSGEKYSEILNRIHGSVYHEKKEEYVERKILTLRLPDDPMVCTKFMEFYLIGTSIFSQNEEKHFLEKTIPEKPQIFRRASSHIVSKLKEIDLDTLAPRIGTTHTSLQAQLKSQFCWADTSSESSAETWMRIIANKRWQSLTSDFLALNKAGALSNNDTYDLLTIKSNIENKSKTKPGAVFLQRPLDTEKSALMMLAKNTEFFRYVFDRYKSPEKSLNFIMEISGYTDNYLSGEHSLMKSPDVNKETIKQAIHEVFKDFFMDQELKSILEGQNNEQKKSYLNKRSNAPI